MKKYVFFLALVLFFSCGEEEELPPIQAANLAEYIADNSLLPLVTDSLIACAAGGQEEFMVNEERPISIFFLPEGNATEFLYFETDSIDVDPEDFSRYKTVTLPDFPLFNGFLRHFTRPAIDRNIWCRVSFLKDNQIYISNKIRLKYNDFPTEFNPGLLEINQDEKLSPVFTWEEGQSSENAIFFQVVSDADKNLLSGTYTFEQEFQFYNLDNVVLNVRDITPAPVLLPDEDYSFLLMGVSIDSWVNLIIEESFDTQ